MRLLTFITAAVLIATLSACRHDQPAIGATPLSDEQIIATATRPATGQPGVQMTLETNAARVFDAGNANLSVGGKSLLSNLLADADHSHSLQVDVFNHEQDHLVKSNPPIAAALSVKRAAALKAYLESPAGGSWRVAQATGQGFRTVNGRAADRRIVIAVLDQ